ncbi:Alpha/Beta hydrolase protein [Pilobolus umbonatus]|nr:Alpha/Beta hydrolase protein [Pilobolus umbonatus]
MITNAEHWFQFKIPEGYNPSIECIRLTLDPVEAVHRPLIVYLVMYLTTHTFNVIFLRWVWGFQPGLTDSRFQWGLLGSLMSCSGRKISYWYRPSDQQVTPVVFIHGIGTGLLGYIEFLHQLLHMNRPVFFVELPYVSMRMVDSVPSARETVMEIRDMLKHHGYSKAVYVSHSLGTATTSWIMNLDPGIVSGSILIDPICFLLHYHHVAFNFVHRLPTRWIEYVVHYLASKEMYISHYISRHFHWFESIYFTQPMHGPLSNATVFLSENDIIVPSLDVYSYLSKHNINAVIMPQLQHAAFLINSKWKNTILNEIKCICIQADKKQVKKINNNKKREVL